MRLIVESGNHYLVKVKAKEPKLLQALKATVDTTQALACVEQQQKSRGRRERRRVEVYAAPPEIDPEWVGLKRVLFVERSGFRDGEAYRRQGYYISSLVTDAEHFARGIRGHWLIENRLHYVKDVGANEDGSGIRSKAAAANLSLLKSLALTLYRKQGYQSLKEATTSFANKVKELLKIMRT